jgi:hypothetical protein
LKSAESDSNQATLPKAVGPEPPSNWMWVPHGPVLLRPRASSLFTVIPSKLDEVRPDSGGNRNATSFVRFDGICDAAVIRRLGTASCEQAQA